MATLSNNAIAQAIYLASRDVSHGEEHNFHKRAIEFLSRRHLLSRSSAILKELQKIIDKHEGLLRVKVSSVLNLATGAKHDMKLALMKRYKAKDVLIDNVLDKNLLGGIKIEARDEVIDLSIRNRMNKLQEYLTRPQ